MALTTYCDLDEVRAALGVNEIEISDAVLNLPVYEIGLVRELNRVSVSLPVAFSVVTAIAEELRTAKATALVDAVHLFSVYASARQVGGSLGTMVPKDVGDGKASVTRFSDSPYRDTLTRVETMFQGTRASLLDAFNTYSETTPSTSALTPGVVFMASGRSYDPVTGS